MNLKCMINGKISGIYLPNYNGDNNLTQGNTIADEYSETLDSGSIILTDVKKIKNLDPYDDVYIWDADFLPNFNGIEMKAPDIHGCVEPKTNIFGNKFYKHFLIDRYTEERNLLNQDNYTYKIELFSETKGMENVVLPNIIITQPLNAEKRLTTFTHMQQYLELYSPKIKIKNGNNWSYQQKYKLSPEMYDLFKNHYCQQFSLNSPTLRELFTKLMVSKDCIPIVRDNIIYPLMLSKTVGEFSISNDNKSFIISNKSSDGYVTQYRTNYNNALTAGPTCHRVEHLGFRNSDEAILTINNMRLETGFPIYKINKIYACYYKKGETIYEDSYDGTVTVGDDVYFLCKHDITDFCVLANERQALYKDTRLASVTNPTIDEMKQCYYFTLAYSIGSNLITGFGETFGHLEYSGLTTWNKEECIFRNLLNNLNRLYPYGVDGKAKILQKYKDTYPSDTSIVTINVQDIFKGFPATRTAGDLETIPTIFLGGASLNGVTGDSLVLKGITFEIDYEGFYNGAIYTNKESYKKPIVRVDNQSDSMPILDLDGIAKERKIEKMGNKTYTISARYENWEDVQNVGTIFRIGGDEENQDDYEEIIIYHRDISLYDNCINVTYFGQESFVLKNFYTSVFAKQRLYNVLDYGNSVTRAENIKDIILFSKTRQYKIQPNISMDYFNLKNYLSCLCQESGNQNLLCEYPIDISIFNFYDIVNGSIQRSKFYFADTNSFVSGNSLCINTKMFDNITMGEFIDEDHLSGKFWLDGHAWTKASDDSTHSNSNYAGTSQELCSIHKDRETGRSEYIKYTFASSEEKSEMYKNISYVRTWQLDKLKLPNIISDQQGTFIGSLTRKTYKDANEIIDTTFQTQIIVDKKDKNDVFIGNNLLKYNNLLRPKENKDNLAELSSIDTIYLVPFQFIKVLPNISTTNKGSLQGFILRLPKSLKNNSQVKGQTLSGRLYISIESTKSDSYDLAVNTNRITKWRFNSNNYDSFSIYFGPNSQDNDIEFIRLNYDNIGAMLYGSTSVIGFNSGYIYLEKISNQYVDETQGINKDEFEYYSNIFMSNIEGGGTTSKKNPVLNNYYENNDFVNCNVKTLAPYDYSSDGRANNMLFGYTSNNGYYVPNPTDPRTQTLGIQNGFTPYGDPYYTYISNYYSFSNDICRVNGNNKYMLSYSFQTYSSDYSNYGVDRIEAFKDLNTANNAYFSWKILTQSDSNQPTEPLKNNTLVCVAAPRIESSLVDEKTTDFSDFAGYSVLMDGSNIRAYTDIFSILDVDNANITTGKLHIDLTHVPSNKDSIQEWIYNAKTNEYYFVCGFNISSEDRTNGYIDIYLSLVGDLDLEVYDDKGILKGYVGNKAKNENDVVDLT